MASQNAELNSELPVAIMPKESTPSGARISRTTSASRPRVESGCSVMAMTPAPRLRAMPARNDTSVVSPPLDRPTQTSSGRDGTGGAVLAVARMEEQRRASRTQDSRCAKRSATACEVPDPRRSRALGSRTASGPRARDRPAAATES